MHSIHWNTRNVQKCVKSMGMVVELNCTKNSCGCNFAGKRCTRFFGKFSFHTCQFLLSLWYYSWSVWFFGSIRIWHVLIEQIAFNFTHELNTMKEEVMMKSNTGVCVELNICIFDFVLAIPIVCAILHVMQWKLFQIKSGKNEFSSECWLK